MQTSLLGIAHQAINAIKKEISGKYNHVVGADIKSFFNNINHEWLVKMLEQRINDKQFIRLIKKWLKEGILHISMRLSELSQSSKK